MSEALRDSYRGTPVHAPGRVFTDLAVAVADGADAISGIGVLGDRQELFRAGGIDADHLASAGSHRRGRSGPGATGSHSGHSCSNERIRA